MLALVTSLKIVCSKHTLAFPLALAFTLALGPVACGDVADDGDGDGASNLAQELVGRWRITRMVIPDPTGGGGFVTLTDTARQITLAGQRALARLDASIAFDAGATWIYQTTLYVNGAVQDASNDSGTWSVEDPNVLVSVTTSVDPPATTVVTVSGRGDRRTARRKDDPRQSSGSPPEEIDIERLP
jgi:hypothetical protein